MKKQNFTAKRVAKFRKKPGRYRDAQVKGLLLVVGESKASASWQLRYEFLGRERWLGLGSAREVKLKQARELADEARAKLRAGIDPLAERHSAKIAAKLAAAKTLTFEEAAKAYYDQHADKWRNQKHRKQFLSTLQTYAYPTIGRLNVADVDTGLVLKCIEPIWKTKTETANRVRGRIESVLDWATVRGYRKGDNPARWKGHLSEVLPTRKNGNVQHHAALPYAELPAFLAELRKREGVAAQALEFTILTAARTGETLGATWNEIDLKNKTWTVPANRIKGGKEHRVPLSDRAVALLKTAFREKNNPHVFIGPRSGGLSNMAMNATLKRMKRDDVTVHGFRSTFMDWCHERTNYTKVVIDMALAHAVGDKVEAAYRRGDLYDKRKKLMDAWGKYCEQPPKAGEVVPLRA